ncbi:uncharacterized protein LOC144436011 [Glandiceps talaboti]
MSLSLLWRGFKTCWSRNCPCFDCFTGDCSGVCMIVICFCTLGVSFTLIGIFVLIKGYVYDDDEFIQIVGIVQFSIGIFFCILAGIGSCAFTWTRNRASVVKRPPRTEHSEGKPPSSLDEPDDIPLSVIQNGITPTSPASTYEQDALDDDEVPPTPPLIGDTPLDISVHSHPSSEFESLNVIVDCEHPVVVVKPRNSISSNDSEEILVNKTFHCHADGDDQQNQYRAQDSNAKYDVGSDVSVMDAEDELV